MTINEDFSDKAEREMKMYDAKMMEQAKLRKLATASLEERINYALGKNENDAEVALVYMHDNHLINPGEKVTEDLIKSYLMKGI
jgi:hypothetical protein